MKEKSSIERPKRNITFKIRVSEAERDLIVQKQAEAGIRSREAYLRKMTLDGYIIRLDLRDVRKMVSLLQNATNNLNQIARRVNETNNIHASDISDLQGNYNELWEQAAEILRNLAGIKP